MKALNVMVRLLLPALLALALVQVGWAHDNPADQALIRVLMRQTWERPNAPLSVDPVVVVGDYAIAGWVQDERGGRALLRRAHGVWDVVLCSGDQLRSPDTVVAVGATPELASKLVSELLAAEQRLAPALLAKFALFEGVVQMDGSATHHGHK